MICQIEQCSGKSWLTESLRPEIRLTMLSEDTSLFRIGLVAFPAARGGGGSFSIGSINFNLEYDAHRRSSRARARATLISVPVSVLAGLTSAFREVADRNPDSRLCEL